MTLQGLINQLENIRVAAEEGDDLKEITPLEVIDALVDYIANEKIRTKVNEIPL